MLELRAKGACVRESRLRLREQERGEDAAAGGGGAAAASVAGLGLGMALTEGHFQDEKYAKVLTSLIRKNEAEMFETKVTLIQVRFKRKKCESEK